MSDSTPLHIDLDPRPGGPSDKVRKIMNATGLSASRIVNNIIEAIEFTNMGTTIVTKKDTELPTKTGLFPLKLKRVHKMKIKIR